MSKEYIAKELARTGLEIGAIKLRPEKPFVWASGYRMPIYNDNRRFLGYPDKMELIAEGFKNIIQDEIIDCDVVAGTAMAGIPHATLLANILGLPMCYIRDNPKIHGLENKIEGIDSKKDFGEKIIIVIEDLISTGGSSARVVQAVRDASGIVDYCLSIFSYGLDKANQAFDALNPKCNVRSLLTYDVLLETAKEIGYLTDPQVALLKEWREDPFGWGEKHGFPHRAKAPQINAD